MRIHAATPELCGAIAQVHVLSWQHAYASLLPAEFLATLSVEKRAAMWRESLSAGNPQLLVAEEAGTVDGFIAFGLSRDQDATPASREVWALYLNPSSWSKGVGRALWLAALERMLAQGTKTITLWVIEGNARAIKFYSAAGFKPEAGSVKSFTLGGEPLNEVRYAYQQDG